MISNTKDATLYTQDNEDDLQSQGYCIQPLDEIFSSMWWGLIVGP